ncbi:hypothetical protein [Mucilaginibacter gotjawali]|nr:hypothetical protein [Mucilaginibacter gotjawali]MBB3056447.1 hypothetical protein [Mucilaginibacter gotjawali]
MNFKPLLVTNTLLICMLFNCCNSSTSKKTTDELKKDTVSMSPFSKISNSNSKDRSNSGEALADSNLEFENDIYLKIDKIYSGKIYTNTKGEDVFYRILEIPEEEYISLFIENIAIGEEGGKYQLVKRFRLTDDHSVLPKFGLISVDSIRFADSITIEGYFNKKKEIINLNTITKI